MDCNHIVDLIINNYEVTTNPKPLYKFFDFAVNYKQSDVVLKILKNKVIFNAIMKHIDERYEGCADIKCELVEDIWKMENKEICMFVLNDDTLISNISPYVFMDITHKMFTEKWTDVIQLTNSKVTDKITCNEHSFFKQEKLDDMKKIFGDLN